MFVCPNLISNSSTMPYNAHIINLTSNRIISIRFRSDYFAFSFRSFNRTTLLLSSRTSANKSNIIVSLLSWWEWFLYNISIKNTCEYLSNDKTNSISAIFRHFLRQFTIHKSFWHSIHFHRRFTLVFSLFAFTSRGIQRMIRSKLSRPLGLGRLKIRLTSFCEIVLKELLIVNSVIVIS